MLDTRRRIRELREIAYDDPTAMRLIEDQDSAVRVMHDLIEIQMDPWELVIRAAHPKFGGVLLDMLGAHFRERPEHKQFIDAVLELSTHDSWKTFFTWDQLWGSLGSNRVIAIFVGPDRLTPEHPMIRIMAANEYWSYRIQWYVFKDDYRRAWDEIRKAAKGILTRKDHTPEEIRSGRVKYFFSADLRALGMFVGLLYVKLTMDGRIKHIPERPNFSLPIKMAQRSAGKNPELVFSRDLPGFAFAEKWFLIKLGSEITGVPHIFKREGGMALAVAGYIHTIKQRGRLGKQRTMMVRRFASSDMREV